MLAARRSKSLAYVVLMAYSRARWMPQETATGRQGHRDVQRTHARTAKRGGRSNARAVTIIILRSMIVIATIAGMILTTNLVKRSLVGDNTANFSVPGIISGMRYHDEYTSPPPRPNPIVLLGTERSWSGVCNLSNSSLPRMYVTYGRFHQSGENAGPDGQRPHQIPRRSGHRTIAHDIRTRLSPQ